MAVEYVNTDNVKALENIEKALHIASLLSDSSSIVRAKRAKAQILLRMGRLSESITFAGEAYGMAKPLNLVHECILALSCVGAAHLERTEFDKALSYHQQAYNLASDAQDSTAMGMALNNIGITHYKLKDYRRSLYYLLEAYQIKTRVGELSFFSPLNIALCYIHLRDYEKARLYRKESVKLCGTECAKFAQVHIGYATGCLYKGLNEYEEAESEFLKSLALAEQVGDNRMTLDNIYMLTEMFIIQRRFEDALLYLRQGERIINKGVPFNMETVKIYRTFSDFFNSVGNFERAAFYQHRYIKLKDSLYSEKLTTNLMKIESAFLERENLERISAQEEIIALKETVIRRQTTLNFAVAFIAILFLAFLALLLRDFRRRKTLNIMLENKVRERTHEIESNRGELFRIIDENDRRWARTHVMVEAALDRIKGLCDTAVRDFDSPAHHAYFQRIGTTADELSRQFMAQANLASNLQTKSLFDD